MDDPRLDGPGAWDGYDGLPLQVLIKLVLIRLC